VPSTTLFHATPAIPSRLELTPVEVAARLRHLPGMVFFDSAKPDTESLSIVAAAPIKTLTGNIKNDWAELQKEIAERRTDGVRDDGLPHGFAAGWMGYDGTFCFGIYVSALIFRHSEQRWYEIGDLASRLGPEQPAACERPHFQSQSNAGEYCEMVSRAQEFIAAGDIYQVNLAHRFVSPWSGDPWAFYDALRHYSPAPNAAYLDLEGRAVLSASPELFLKISGRSISTRPIKGTRPRRSDPMADEKSAFDLLTSPKEVSELVMITDLERNDLGMVCDFGTVSVPELLKLERHEQVFHLVSTVQGRLRAGVDHAGAVAACFPGGSITGAPKKRAMEIIAELERTPRGLYTGAIGWIGFNEESEFSITTRTVIIEENEAHFHVGAGIVADSIPAAEWQETLDKAAGILLAAERL
jgi:para-aminobenzoate synthetase component I